MEIAKKVTKEYFLALDLSSTGKDWDEAILILRKRIYERFIEPADKLIELEDNLKASDKKYGFTILSIDCLLCEAIQSFYEGIEDSSGQSKRLFVRFLRERKGFQPYFDFDQQAEAFYTEFRCSLLHQAQTTGLTKIWAVGPLINRASGETRVNRLAFHKTLKDEFDLYLTLLADGKHAELRANFKKKMFYIAKNG